MGQRAGGRARGARGTATAGNIYVYLRVNGFIASFITTSTHVILRRRHNSSFVRYYVVQRFPLAGERGGAGGVTHVAPARRRFQTLFSLQNYQYLCNYYLSSVKRHLSF